MYYNSTGNYLIINTRRNNYVQRLKQTNILLNNIVFSLKYTRYHSEQWKTRFYDFITT